MNNPEINNAKTKEGAIENACSAVGVIATFGALQAIGNVVQLDQRSEALS